MKYAGELNKSWINLGPTMWLCIIYEIGTQIHLDKDLNLGGQGEHPHPQLTKLRLRFLPTSTLFNINQQYHTNNIFRDPDTTTLVNKRYNQMHASTYQHLQTKQIS